jgi:hypothetical protein
MTKQETMRLLLIDVRAFLRNDSMDGVYEKGRREGLLDAINAVLASPAEPSGKHDCGICGGVVDLSSAVKPSVKIGAGAPLKLPACWCHRCQPRTGFATHMIVCPDCGNKRCPKASDHALSCTNSNEPGQPGSVYQ